MKVLVFGGGATGSLLAARLHSAGLPVVLIGRPDHVRAIAERGLEVEGLPGGPFRFPAETTVPAGSAFDRILLTVKAGDLESAARALSSALRRPAPLLALQNGLGIRERLVVALSTGGWAFAGENVTRGIQIVAATALGPGRIRLVGDGEIILGAGGAAGPLNGFDALLAQAGIRARVVPSIEREEWRKAIVNAAMNPVTADHGIENGRLAESPWREQALALLEEARRVAEAEGYGFSRAEVEADFQRILRLTAGNRSSMLQDLERHRPTEIDAINGEILRRGERHGLSLPNTARAVERIRARANARSGSGPGLPRKTE